MKRDEKRGISFGVLFGIAISALVVIASHPLWFDSVVRGNFDDMNWLDRNWPWFTAMIVFVVTCIGMAVHLRIRQREKNAWMSIVAGVAGILLPISVLIIMWGISYPHNNPITVEEHTFE